MSRARHFPCLPSKTNGSQAAAMALQCLAEGEVWWWPLMEQLRPWRDLCKQTPWGNYDGHGWVNRRTWGSTQHSSVPSPELAPPLQGQYLLMEAEWDGALRWFPLLCGRLLFKPFRLVRIALTMPAGLRASIADVQDSCQPPNPPLILHSPLISPSCHISHFLTVFFIRISEVWF